MDYREENDAMGMVRIPAGAHYGAQTQRAMDNFPISGLTLPDEFIRTLALIKKCAAAANRDLGLLDPEAAEAIISAALEAMEGKRDDDFVVDVFQTGSGTSTNMNMNEVLASRSNEILTGKRGGKVPVHPNDHVNMGQSSNDVIPSALHIACLQRINTGLIPALESLHQALVEKAEAFSGIRKIGRTHLQDAVPMTLGQEFAGYAGQILHGIQRLWSLEGRLSELALGGTAVGTGVNTHPEFAKRTIFLVSEATGLSFRETDNHFRAQACQDTSVETSGVLKTVSVGLAKIANDIRWLASGPRCGIGEIAIPALQPGSSIMPGKVNPVIPEAVLQVTMQVAGNDTAILLGGQSGYFELNTALPLIAHNLLQSIQLLTSSAAIFADRCVGGITANADRCAEYVEKSLALATVLVPHLGYDRASEIAKTAYSEGLTVKEVAEALGIAERTVGKQWATVRLWLRKYLKENPA
jgi:fumarate hydratase class II